MAARRICSPMQHIVLAKLCCYSLQRRLNRSYMHIVVLGRSNDVVSDTSRQCRPHTSRHTSRHFMHIVVHGHSFFSSSDQGCSLLTSEPPIFTPAHMMIEESPHPQQGTKQFRQKMFSTTNPRSPAPASPPQSSARPQRVQSTVRSVVPADAFVQALHAASIVQLFRPVGRMVEFPPRYTCSPLPSAGVDFVHANPAGGGKG